MTEAAKRIFVGGLGRSGTTLITELLGRHPAVAALAWETRFIVDADGLGELVHALSRDWAGPSTAGMKVQAFRQMMKHDLLTPESHPYVGYSMTEHFERAEYEAAVNAFFRRVIRTEWPATGLSANRTTSIEREIGTRQLRITVEDRAPTRILPYVFDFEEIRGIAAELVDSLFFAYAGRRGCTIWAEKTPHNIMSPYPRLLFPDCFVIHILRDPRDVVASIANAHSWGPTDVRDAIDWVAEFYRRWLVLRPQYLRDSRYIEVRYEELVREPEATLREICGHLSLEFVPDMVAPDLHRNSVGRFASAMSESDVDYFAQQVACLAEQAGFRDFKAD